MEDPAINSDVISDDHDLLILVDSCDKEIGELDKEACHDGSGKLHRAISVFIFNRDDELLIQQRHARKQGTNLHQPKNLLILDGVYE